MTLLWLILPFSATFLIGIGVGAWAYRWTTAEDLRGDDQVVAPFSRRGVSPITTGRYQRMTTCGVAGCRLCRDKANGHRR